MRIARLFPFLLFSLSIGLRAQKVTTVFVDSISIKVNNEIIYSHCETYLKFLPSDKPRILKLFDNGTYIFQLEFTSILYDDYGFFRSPDVKLYKNDILQAFGTDALTMDSDYKCSWLPDYRYKITPIINEPGNQGTEIFLRFRYFGFAPKDTLNYHYNYRQGEWVGSFVGMKEIMVNFSCDKKHGPAQVIYNDGTIFKTWFMYGFADNNGHGIFENRKSSKYPLPYILTKTCDDHLKALCLIKKNNQKEIKKGDLISIHSVKKGNKNDSIQYILHGDLITIIRDSMIVRAKDVEVHDFYREEKDSSYFYSKKLPEQFQKVPLKEIVLIKKSRKALQNSVIALTLISLVSAVVVSPLVSIENKSFNANKFSKISGVSIGVGVFSVGVGALLGSKKFLIKPTLTKKDVWKMKPDYR